MVEKRSEKGEAQEIIKLNKIVKVILKNKGL